MIRHLATPYQVMFLITVVLSVYYPTQFGEINLVDDLGTISTLFSAEHLSLVDILIPRGTNGGYYRPIIGISFWLDKQLWFLDERLLHFESVVGHILNGVLVFVVTRKASQLYLGTSRSYLAVTTALFFVLHPITTESVNWISGRTDLIMTTLLLTSLYSLLGYLQSRSRFKLLFSLLCAVTALLSKEAAFGYLLGLPLLLSLQTSELMTNSNVSYVKIKQKVYLFGFYFVIASMVALIIGAYWLVLVICLAFLIHMLYLKSSANISQKPSYQTFKSLIIVLISLVISIGLAIEIRRMVFVSSVSKIGQTIQLMYSDLNYTISIFLGAIGFYIKKFFIPVPLNFYIREIDPLYDFIGIAALMVVMYLLLLRTLPAFLLLTAIFLVLPALPFAFGTIAWTAYAERYIYSSSAFGCIALSLVIGKYLINCKHRVKIGVQLVMMLCIVIAGAISYSRNVLWMHNVDLMQDTVAKSPTNRIVRDIYIKALLSAGYAEEAKRQYRFATNTMPAPHYDDLADVLIGNQLVKEKNYSAAYDHYKIALKRTNYSSEGLLLGIVQVLKTMKSAPEISRLDYKRLVQEEQKYTDALNKLTHNPPLLIEAGKVAATRGSFHEASSFYDAALQYAGQERNQRMAIQRLKDQVSGKGGKGLDAH